MLKQRQAVKGGGHMVEFDNCHTATNEVDVNKPLCSWCKKLFFFFSFDRQLVHYHSPKRLL